MYRVPVFKVEEIPATPKNLPFMIVLYAETLPQMVWIDTLLELTKQFRIN